MSARERIEWITNHWYAFAVIAAGVSLLTSGFGIFSLLLTGVGLVFSLGLTWLLGKWLLAKSSFTRVFLVVASVILIGLNMLGLAKSLWFVLFTWSFSHLLGAAMNVAMIVMFSRSFKALTDKSVKAYCA